MVVGSDEGKPKKGSLEFELGVVHCLRHGGVGLYYNIKAGRAAEPLARRDVMARPHFALLRPLSVTNRSREMD